MEIEQKQAEHIDYFVKQASNRKCSALQNVVVEATSHPCLFAFSEILSVLNVLELEGTEDNDFLDLLHIFAHGTWSDYKSVSSHLPPLVPGQVLKLKQLTVLTMAEKNKVLPYDALMQELDVTNVRELEDFLINDCIYAGIIRGKLDHFRRHLEVLFAAGRDLKPGNLGSMIQTLANWLSTSESLLALVKKIQWADTLNEIGKNHRTAYDEKVEDIKRRMYLKKAELELQRHYEVVMDFEEGRNFPKRRRHLRGRGRS